jgi:hypothetical protein
MSGAEESLFEISRKVGRISLGVWNCSIESLKEKMYCKSRHLKERGDAAVPAGPRDDFWKIS